MRDEPEEILNVTVPELRGASLARFLKSVALAVEEEALG